MTINGGKVVANIALTGKDCSSKIEISDEMLNNVRQKFGDIENEFRKITGYGFDGLTQSEARYITLGISSDKFRNRIIEESQKAKGRAISPVVSSGNTDSDTQVDLSNNPQARLTPQLETLEDSKMNGKREKGRAPLKRVYGDVENTRNSIDTFVSTTEKNTLNLLDIAMTSEEIHLLMQTDDPLAENAFPKELREKWHVEREQVRLRYALSSLRSPLYKAIHDKNPQEYFKRFSTGAVR